MSANEAKPPKDTRDWMGIEEAYAPDPDGEIILNGKPHRLVRRDVVGFDGKRYPLD